MAAYKSNVYIYIYIYGVAKATAVSVDMAGDIFDVLCLRTILFRMKWTVACQKNFL